MKEADSEAERNGSGSSVGAVGIRVHLYGTLPQRFPSYDPDRGIEIVLPGGASVRDLIRQLGFTDSDGGIVASGGRVLALDAPLKDGMAVQVLQQVHGG